ncbi:ABC transporter ATP-binding protein [Solicola gregarius]|uniref:ABC transporter ATP-binding protein/permease n=1 Tax=Solicola gregarius TaxID=2908642 RepID=A0AA46TGD8_9ACTN|nr:ABC transporter ATP-binding protein [Solicola gregarius]UYM04354.1 ABC transporter ATP-binding protein/permease [Solicola gregarius]
MTAGPVSAPASGGALIARAYRREWRRVVAGVAGLSLHQLCEAMVPVAIGLIIDQAVVARDVSALGIGVAGMVALFTVLMLAYRTGARVLFYAVQRESHRLRVLIAEHVLHGRGARMSLRSGELLSVASTDADLTGMTLRLSGFGAGGLVAIATSAVVLLRIDVVLGVGVLVGVPAIVVLLQVLAPWMTRRSAEQQAAIGRTTAMATDLVRGVRVLHGIGAERQALRRYEQSSQEALGAALWAARWRGLLLGVSETASGLFLAAVAGTAGWFALDGRISVGELVTVIGLAQFVSEPVRMLGGVAEDIATFRASADRVAGVLRSPLVADDGTRVAPSGQGVTVESLSYRSLAGVDLTVRPGEMVGVVALDPHEGDALVDVLAGRADPRECGGVVRVGDVPVTSASRDSVRAAVLVEPHDVALFEGTLDDNLHLGPAAVDAPSLDAVLAATSADDVVASHPAGLERALSERGSDLSGGQRQRVALARALLADPGVLVLHDPTTAVDAVTEANVAGGLARVRHADQDARSTVVVTASPALLAAADRVVVIDGGAVAAEGAHDELLAEHVSYRARVAR